MNEITLPLVATSAEHAPKSSREKRRVLQNAEKEKLVLGFLHSVNHTGSPQVESYIHTYFIPGQNTKSSKHKFCFVLFLKQPTILDTTQSTADLTSISIYISLIYN